jgi:hypothetical protein
MFVVDGLSFVYLILVEEHRPIVSELSTLKKLYRSKRRKEQEDGENYIMWCFVISDSCNTLLR